MNSYTYNDVSWRVFSGVNSGEVVRDHLKAKEMYHSKLISFLWNAMVTMSYTCKDGPITYTISETEYGYWFQMHWTTTKMKAAVIEEYAELLKTPARPDTGKSEWRKSLVSSLVELLGFSSAFDYSHRPTAQADICEAVLTAEVRFESLIDARDRPRFYYKAPQRQLCIFDVFDFESIKEKEFRIEFDCKEWVMGLRIEAGDKQLEFDMSEYNDPHFYLLRLLQAVHNVVHPASDEFHEVNVARFTSTVDRLTEFYTVKQTMHTRYYNHEGPTADSIDFRVTRENGYTIYILARREADLPYEDDWFYGDLYEYLYSFDHEPKTKEQLEAPIIFAVKIELRIFLEKLIRAVMSIKYNIGEDKYKEWYNHEFPQEMLDKLKK